jgi:hypothetical protein
MYEDCSNETRLEIVLVEGEEAVKNISLQPEIT